MNRRNRESTARAVQSTAMLVLVAAVAFGPAATLRAVIDHSTGGGLVAGSVALAAAALALVALRASVVIAPWSDPVRHYGLPEQDRRRTTRPNRKKYGTIKVRGSRSGGAAPGTDEREEDVVEEEAAE